MNFFTRFIILFFVFIIIYKILLTFNKHYQYNIYNPPKLKTVKEKRKIPTNDIFKTHLEEPIKHLYELDFYVIYDFEPLEFEYLNNQDNLENQNVHDNKIQRSLRKEFEKINTTDIKDDNILQNILQNSPDIYKDNVEKILNHIKKTNTEMVGYNDETIVDIMKKVYSNLQTHDEIDFFYNNLNDCIDENNKVICSTGIVSRILSTRFLNNPDKFPKSENYIFQEMLNKASNIRKDEEDDDIFKKKFREEIKKSYSDILTEKEIDEKITEICNNL